MLAAVVSDTHGITGEVVRVLQRYRLDALFFLGDYCPDGRTIADELKPDLPLFAVAGNGDAFRDCLKPTRQTVKLGGKTFFLAHGHQFRVKQMLEPLMEAGQEAGAEIILYGHTHIPRIERWGSGWVMNPGSAAFPRGVDDATFGLIEWQENTPVTLMILEVDGGRLLYSSVDYV